MPGLAVRLAARRARGVFLGLPGPAERLPGAAIDRATPCARPWPVSIAPPWRPRPGAATACPPGATVLGVLGGSLGARVLNQAVAGIVAAPGEAGPLAVVHLAGVEAETVAPQAAAAPLPWRCLPFEEQMEFFYAAADLVLVPRRGHDHLRAGRHRHAGGAGPAGSGGPAAQRRRPGGGRRERAWSPRVRRPGCPRWWGACWRTPAPGARWPERARAVARPGAADEIAAPAAGGGGWLTWPASAASTWSGWAASA